MKDFAYHLSVKDCRSIKSAEIDLAEITVLTGINGSGKSTIARMLRDFVETSAQYERLQSVRIWNERMRTWRYALTPQMTSRHVTGGDDDELIRGKMSLADAIERIRREVRYLSSQHPVAGVAHELTSHGGVVVSRRSRLDWARQRIRRLLDLKNGEDISSVFENDARHALDQFESVHDKRSYKDLFEDGVGDGQITFTEGDHVIFSNKKTKNKFDGISFLKRAIYIESPFKSVPQSVSVNELDMGDDFVRIKDKSSPEGNGRLPELNAVISGTVDFVRDFDNGTERDEELVGKKDGHWVYRRTDGKQFILEDCATGIKAFSVLDTLLAKGWLDAETLLIIDEPEAHLHPQWVVEYARILLLLAKKRRVRLFIASHSPDMVNALHTIGGALRMHDDMGFYLAEEDGDDKFQFRYDSLGAKVGRIFKAYNVSFDRIDQYAQVRLP